MSRDAEGYDYAIQREPEWVIRDLIRCLDAGDEDGARAVLGVTARDVQGAIIHNLRYPYIEDLDEIPSDVTLLPLQYVYFNPIVKNLPYITVSTSHGCPAKCSYCTAPFFHGPVLVSCPPARSCLTSNTICPMASARSFRDETFTAD